MPYKKVKTITLTQLLENYKPAYGKSWMKAFDQLLAEEAEVKTIEKLMSERRSGTFDQPVLLDKKRKRVRDGMHRVTAAYLGGHDLIDVAFKYKEEPNREYLEFNVTFSENAFENSQMSEDWPLMHFRSFPTPGRWADAGVVASQSSDATRNYFAILPYPHGEKTNLEEGLRMRAKELGLVLKSLDIQISSME